MVTPSDHELALRARRGDVDAFGELVQRYQAAVFNVCYRLVGQRQEAEDLAQESFVRAYQRFELYDVQRPFGPWMRRLAANVCLNHLQSERNDVVLSLDDERDEGRAIGSLAGDSAERRSIEVQNDDGVAPNVRGPEAALEQRQSSHAVRAALLSLPPHYRAVIELRHFQELSYAEIAEQLHIPLSDVKSYLFRARRLLAVTYAAAEK